MGSWQSAVQSTSSTLSASNASTGAKNAMRNSIDDDSTPPHPAFTYDAIDRESDDPLRPLRMSGPDDSTIADYIDAYVEAIQSNRYFNVDDYPRNLQSLHGYATESVDAAQSLAETIASKSGMTRRVDIDKFAACLVNIEVKRNEEKEVLPDKARGARIARDILSKLAGMEENWWTILGEQW